MKILNNKHFIIKFIKPVLIIILMIAAFILRIKLFSEKTHWSDMYFWQDWGKYMAQFGPQNFYDHFNSDYLPFYPLILGLVYKLFNLTSSLHNIPIYYFYKLPASLADIIVGFLIFILVKKSHKKLAFLGLVLFLFNPAVFANSSMWGQVDIIGTLFVILALYFLKKENFLFPAIFSALALTTKTIYLLILPVFIIFSFKISKNKKRQFIWFIKKMFIFFITLGLVFWLVFYPFTDVKNGFFNLLKNPFLLAFDRYKIISSRYQYASVNAFNFWALVDEKFWTSDLRSFLGLSLFNWGNIINLAVIISSLLALLYKRKENLLYQISLSLSVLFLSSFLFLTRIHERHMYYIFPFLLISAILKKRLMIAYFILSFTYVLNLNFGLEYLYQDKVYIYSRPLIILIASINVLMFFWLFVELLINIKIRKSEKKS